MSEQGFSNNYGFSLIELLTALMVTSLLLGLLLSGLIYVKTIDEKAAVNQKLYYNQRYIELFFQKQVLESETIYYKGGRVYLQDLERPELYNYYHYSSGYLRRYKVWKDGLRPIGMGQNSQFTDGIEDFSLSLGPHQEIILKYSLAIEGTIYYRETTISHGRVVELL